MDYSWDKCRLEGPLMRIIDRVKTLVRGYTEAEDR